MKNYQTPKQVSDFAKNYEQMYIALRQAERVVVELKKQINMLKNELSNLSHENKK